MAEFVSNSALYFVCWWIVLFIILPIGVKTQEEEGKVKHGSIKSAPLNPHIKKKFIYTCVFAFLPFIAIKIILATEILTITNITKLTDILTSNN